MACKGKQQKQVHQKEPCLQTGILLFSYENSTNTPGHGHCRIACHAPLDHIFADQTAQIFFIINFIIKKRHIILRLKSFRTKKRHDHRKKHYSRQHYRNKGVSCKNRQPFQHILHRPL